MVRLALLQHTFLKDTLAVDFKSIKKKNVSKLM